MSIWNIPELRTRTEAASRLPKSDLPEVGTVVFDNGHPQVVRHINGSYVSSILAGGYGREVHKNWRYATPAEIDQFERDSKLPDIVDPIEAEVKVIADSWLANAWTVERIARAAINRGIEIGQARKAGA